jgi:hypothetical protein
MCFWAMRTEIAQMTNVWTDSQLLFARPSAREERDLRANLAEAKLGGTIVNVLD